MIARQRGADDGLVERGEEDADHHRAEDAHPDGMRELDGRAIDEPPQAWVVGLDDVTGDLLASLSVDVVTYQVIRKVSFLIGG